MDNSKSASEYRTLFAPEITRASSRILRSEEYRPQIFLVKSDFNSYVFDFRFWIGDPQSGISNVKSDLSFHLDRLLIRESVVLRNRVYNVEYSDSLKL